MDNMSASGPEASFADPEKALLIQKIANLLGPEIIAPKNRTIWGALWLADTEMLRGLSELPPINLRSSLRFAEISKVIAKWMQRDKTSESKLPSLVTSTQSTPNRARHEDRPALSPSLDLSSALASAAASRGTKRSGDTLDSNRKKAKTRDSQAPKICHERDVQCVTTQKSDEMCQAAHLYPFSMSEPGTLGVTDFWAFLRTFWTTERVDSWWDAVYGDVVATERPENMILLSHDAHHYHTLGRFALEPLSKDPDGRSLSLRFWWLRPSNSEPDQVNLITRPRLNCDPKEFSMGMLNVGTYQPVRSGDVITISTNDSASHPLPDTRLLELQWVLNRLTALRGAAEPDDFDDYDDDDDDCDDDYRLPSGYMRQPSSAGSAPSSRTSLSSPKPTGVAPEVGVQQPEEV